MVHLLRRRLVPCLATLLATSAILAQQPRTATVPTPDVTLTTFTYGAPSSATPVIAVNGGPGLSHVYMIQNNVWTVRIPAHRQVIMYDQRGTGASPLTNPAAPQTMDAQVADLEAVRASLHVGKVHFLGDSYGGLLVSAYAAAHPEHVLTLTLSDSAAPGFAALHPRLHEAFPDVIAATKEKIAKLSGPDKAAKAADLDLDAHMRMIFYSPELADRYLNNAPPGLGNAPAAGEAVSKAIEKLDLTPQMAEFRFPVLVLQGRYDLNVTPDVSWTVAHNIPGAQLVFFEHSGHLPYYEEPEKYAQVVEQFLEAHDPSGH
ncbi:MAG TPA: alpha/beta hydrolase [Acidobacteriaceae bacterium]|nr:alpha/beta hydrolase [Acidobacteriaceae bacterium]